MAMWWTTRTEKEPNVTHVRVGPRRRHGHHHGVCYCYSVRPKRLDFLFRHIQLFALLTTGIASLLVVLWGLSYFRGE